MEDYFRCNFSFFFICIFIEYLLYDNMVLDVIWDKYMGNFLVDILFLYFFV